MFRLIYCSIINVGIVFYDFYFSNKFSIKLEIGIQYFEENALEVSARILLYRLLQISSRQILELVRDDLQVGLTP